MCDTWAALENVKIHITTLHTLLRHGKNKPQAYIITWWLWMKPSANQEEKSSTNMATPSQNQGEAPQE